MLTEPNLHYTPADVDALMKRATELVTEVEQLRAEVDRQAAELTEIRAAGAYRVETLERIADRARAIGQPATSIVTLTERGLALEAWDDSVPPGGMVCAVCGVPVESERCPQHGPKVVEEP